MCRYLRISIHFLLPVFDRFGGVFWQDWEFFDFFEEVLEDVEHAPQYVSDERDVDKTKKRDEDRVEGIPIGVIYIETNKDCEKECVKEESVAFILSVKCIRLAYLQGKQIGQEKHRSA